MTSNYSNGNRQIRTVIETTASYMPVPVELINLNLPNRALLIWIFMFSRDDSTPITLKTICNFLNVSAKTGISLLGRLIKQNLIIYSVGVKQSKHYKINPNYNWASNAGQKLPGLYFLQSRKSGLYFLQSRKRKLNLIVKPGLYFLQSRSIKTNKLKKNDKFIKNKYNQIIKEKNSQSRRVEFVSTYQKTNFLTEECWVKSAQLSRKNLYTFVRNIPINLSKISHFSYTNTRCIKQDRDQKDVFIQIPQKMNPFLIFSANEDQIQQPNGLKVNNSLHSHNVKPNIQETADVLILKQEKIKEMHGILPINAETRPLNVIGKRKWDINFRNKLKEFRLKVNVGVILDNGGSSKLNELVPAFLEMALGMNPMGWYKYFKSPNPDSKLPYGTVPLFYPWQIDMELFEIIYEECKEWQKRPKAFFKKTGWDEDDWNLTIYNLVKDTLFDPPWETWGDPVKYDAKKKKDAADKKRQEEFEDKLHQEKMAYLDYLKNRPRSNDADHSNAVLSTAQDLSAAALEMTKSNTPIVTVVENYEVPDAWKRTEAEKEEMFNKLFPQFAQK